MVQLGNSSDAILVDKTRKRDIPELLQLTSYLHRPDTVAAAAAVGRNGYENNS